MYSRRCASQAAPGLSEAFTLIELLVAVVIVALLVSLAAPSLEVARQRSKTATCLERLRAIAEASHAYAQDDPHNLVIPVHPLALPPPLTAVSNYAGAYEWGGKSGIGEPDFVPGLLDPLGSRYGTRAGFGPASRPLNKYLYPHGLRDNLNPSFERFGATLDTQLELEAFRCPGDDGPPGGAHCSDWVNNPERTSYDHFGTSYAANLFMVSAQGGGEMRSNSPYLRPLSGTPNPVRTLLYEENIGRWAWAARREQCDFIQPGIDPGPTKHIRGWHGKDWIFNRAFVDAHAERQKVYLERTEDVEGYALHYASQLLDFYPDWPGCFTELGGRGSFEQYRCIIVRGPGWQKDTLPAPLICTGMLNAGSGRASYEGCVSPGLTAGSSVESVPTGAR
jgi:prepilin-type N-terminal cleavage/methylation domain-containing protein